MQIRNVILRNIKTPEIFNAKIVSWGDDIDLYNIQVIGGSNAYNLPGPSGLNVNDWVTVSKLNGVYKILNETKYDPTDIIEVTV